MTALEERTDRALQLAAAFERSGDIRLLDRAIDLFAEVVAADDDTGPDRARHLDNLGVALLTRFEARQDRAALARALMYSRRAATMAGPGQHPDHALHLSNFSNTALAWFDETGEASVLDEAVAAGAAAVRLGAGDEHEELFRETSRAARVRRFEQHVARAVACGESFARTSSPHDLAAAVAAGRAAVADSPADEPRRWTAWSNLSHVLRMRFELLGDDGDLTDAVEFGRTALHLAENGGAPVPGNPDPPSSCAVNLAAALLARLFVGGPTSDADEVIDLGSPIAESARTLDSHRLLLMSHLVGALQERARRAPTREAALPDLDDAVALAHELVALAEPEDRGLHLANLANCLLTRRGDGDVAAAIRYTDEAMCLLPCDTQEWARAGATRATAYGTRWLATDADGDATAALEQLFAVARSPVVAAGVRLGAARDAAALATRCGRRPLALEAARAAVALLPVVAWWGLDRRSRTGQLARWPDVGLDAAAVAMIGDRPHEAAVLAEQGRGVLWAQTLHARSELDLLRRRAPALAERLLQVRDTLDGRFGVPS
jgi:tetratricopeptide (TPR) repeat protein